MANIKITLPDGSVQEHPAGITGAEIAAAIGKRLAQNALAVKVNGNLTDLSAPIGEDATVEIVTFDAPEGKTVFRHSSSHVLAQAVRRLYPGVRLAIGPAIADGFYYDFDVPKPFTTEDLAKIEAEMAEIVKADLPFERIEVSREEALRLFGEAGEVYKVELIEDLPEDAAISLYRQGDFVDLCAGPHLPSTKMIGAVKLMSVAGAYWRGDEKRPMLQRVYGTSFPRPKELAEYLERLEEAKRRDHRKIGKELDLFSIQEEGPGFPFFHPKGMVLRNILEDFWRREHFKRGYQEIKTPIILNEELWKRSGHYEHYRENMYYTKIDEQDYCVKPMNCPGGMLLYRQDVHSYRDFPLRVAELGLVHRHELSGALHGLMRVRCFTQDDAHIYMLPEQIRSEIQEIIKLDDYMYKVFGFDYHVELSTKPEKALGTDEDWERATDALRDALEDLGVNYKINPGDGAFYGPKIDFHLQDCLGRTWQCGTIQLDMQMPELFDLTYVGADGERHRPIMIHRTVLGSFERFIGILIEHFAGAFPVWLAPVQVKVIPIADRHTSYAQKLCRELSDGDIRVEMDGRNEKIGYKIREAQGEKIPYMLVVGDKEMANGTVSVRTREGGDQGAMDFAAFVSKIREEIGTKYNYLTDGNSCGIVK
ncbi:MAG: threonine--tRNA ligase [bacterium]